jgi:DNA-binding response OmpR family regulator
MPHLRNHVHRKGYILVLEGDDLIRQLLERWLTEGGYSVAARDVERLRLEGRSEPAPSLVILDVADPRSAEALIRSVQAVHAVPVIAVSARFRRGLGTSHDAAVRFGACKLLPKPFSREELMEAVREAMVLGS